MRVNLNEESLAPEKKLVLHVMREMGWYVKRESQRRFFVQIDDSGGTYVTFSIQTSNLTIQYFGSLLLKTQESSSFAGKFNDLCHRWVREMFPEQYTQMLAEQHERKNRNDN